MNITLNNKTVIIEGNKIIIDCGDIDPAAFFQSKVAIGTLEPGARFTQDGETFIVLEKLNNGGVFVISESFMEESMKFGSNSNWKESNIRTNLNSGSIFKRMVELFGEENIRDMDRDLTSLDGLDDYGVCVDKVSLLTASEYAKYHKILGLNSNYPDWWWLITPASTPSNGYTGSVCCVCSDGLLFWDGCGYGCGVRPVLALESSTLVSCD